MLLEDFSQEGESVDFLKRQHTVSAEGGVYIQAQEELFSKMCAVLGVHEKKASKAPPSKELVRPPGVREPLDFEHVSKCRTAIGIAMYASSDRSDAAHTIRSLAQRLAHPTWHDYKCAQKLASYLKHTAGYCAHISQIRVFMLPTILWRRFLIQTGVTIKRKDDQ